MVTGAADGAADQPAANNDGPTRPDGVLARSLSGKGEMCEHFFMTWLSQSPLIPSCSQSANIRASPMSFSGGMAVPCLFWLCSNNKAA